MAIKSRRSRSPLFYGGAIAVLLVIGLAVGLGVGLGVTRSNGNNQGTAQGSSNNPSNADDAAPANVTPLAKWDWTTQKMVGMALGNWLLLERWMHEDYFVGLVGTDVWDEWGFSRALGDRAAPVLREHFESWLNETDVEAMAEGGINHIRVPVGHWALIPTVGNEPYVNASQMMFVERLMGWAHKRNMHVLLDLHGVPGNANGEQQSGHNTTEINFYNSTNQARADQMIAAAISFVQESPYSSVISGISVVNEPRPYDSETNRAALRDYYERSYATLSAAGIPMIWHHAFIEGDRLAYWSDFMAGKNPSMLVLEDHPYPGNFPAVDDRDGIMSQVCDNARSYQRWPIPVVVTEWSLTTGVRDYTWMRSFYAAQLTAWSWSAGGSFWAWRTTPSTGGTSPWNNTHIETYSWVDLVTKDAIILPSNSSQSSEAFLANLQQDAQCGAPPTHTFVNPVPASSASPSASSSASAASETTSAAGGGGGDGGEGDGSSGDDGGGES